MRNETARHYAYQPSAGLDLGLSGRAARFVVAAGLAGALWAAPAVALADDADPIEPVIELTTQDESEPSVELTTQEDTEEQQETEGEGNEGEETPAEETPVEEEVLTEGETPSEELVLATASESEEAEPVLEAAAEAQITYSNMYRLYNPNSGEHFYTANLGEAKHIVEVGWRWEGVGWVAPDSGTQVFRLYNPVAGDHHYTTDAGERDYLASVGWIYEGVGWYSDDDASGIAVLRQYNPNAWTGAHNFTTSSSEDSYLGTVGWTKEGVAWRASNQPTQAIEAFWIVSPAWGSVERYWIDSSATLASDRLITPDEGAGWYAYAKPGGAVVRGKWDNGAGYVYVADGDSRLMGADMTQDGWLVTAAYDGEAQRYWFDATKKAARTGWIYVSDPYFAGEDLDGNPINHVWGVSGQGYILRNGAVQYDGKNYRANNDGVLTEINTGWSYINGHWYYASANPSAFFAYDVDQNGNSLGHYDVLHELWLLVNGYTSGSMTPYHSRTGYLIASSWDACYTAVFEGQANSSAQDNWMPLFGWNCANGLPSKIEAQEHKNNPGSTWRWDPSWNRYLAEENVSSNMPEILKQESEWATHLDTSFSGSRVRAVNPSEQYFTSVSWTLGFHSWLESSSELGKHLSYGCIRLHHENAAWIYNNVAPGTRVMQVRTSIAN